MQLKAAFMNNPMAANILFVSFTNTNSILDRTMTSSFSVAPVNEFPASTIAVLVHKHYVERVQEYLLCPTHAPTCWKRMSHGNTDSEDDANKTSSTSEVDTKKDNGQFEKNKVTVLDITETTGNSHDRQGYHLLLVQATERPISQISPMARQNVAWAFKITHQYQLPVPMVKIDGRVMVQEIVRQILATISLESIPILFNDKQHILRINCYPKKYYDDIYLALQQAVCAKLKIPSWSSSSPPEVPWEGPIAMTRSASKCTHRLDIILSSSSASTSTSVVSEPDSTTAESKTIHNLPLNDDADFPCVYWGWLDRNNNHDKNILETRLNEFAAQEIKAVAPDHVTGKEVLGKELDTEVPLSRAYYKLEQVWDDILDSPHEQYVLTSILQQQPPASAVDFGSAPGGWTQILAQRTTTGSINQQLKAICAVDKGKVADRVVQTYNHVHHIPSVMEDCAPLLQPYGPFGIVVCDASLLWSELLEILLRVVRNMSAAQPNNDNQEKQQSPSSSAFTLPCILVLTMKLPYQTLQSIQRHVRLIHEQVPKFLHELAAAMYPNFSQQDIQSRDVLVHLMANSSSERTLIVIFENSQQKDNQTTKEVPQSTECALATKRIKTG